MAALRNTIIFCGVILDDSISENRIRFQESNYGQRPTLMVWDGSGKNDVVTAKEMVRTKEVGTIPMVRQILRRRTGGMTVISRRSTRSATATNITIARLRLSLPMVVRVRPNI